MIVNAIFDDVKVYNVGDRLDVVTGQTFKLEIVEGEPAEGFSLFSDNDPVLSIASGLTISADELGLSKLRFMSGVSVLKDIDIQVVDATHPMATTLGLALGDPVQK